jgi:hypothetical protein
MSESEGEFMFGVKFNKFKTQTNKQYNDLTVNKHSTSKKPSLFEKTHNQNTNNENTEKNGLFLLNSTKLFTKGKLKPLDDLSQGGNATQSSYLQEAHLFKSYRTSSARKSKILNESILGGETAL